MGAPQFFGPSETMADMADVSMITTVEAGKPNKGYGGARVLHGDLRDNCPETHKHLKNRLKASSGSAIKSQEDLIKETKARLAAKKGPETQEQKEEKARQQKIKMLMHKCGVGGRRTPNGGFFT